MGRPWLECLRGTSEHNHGTCPGVVTVTRRTGLAHRCIAFVRPHRSTVFNSGQNRCMAWARRVPPGV